jgi:hypothetical protein
MATNLNREPNAPLGPDEAARKAIIELIGLIVMMGFALAVFYHYYVGAYLGRGYPYDTFLFRPAEHFNDFKNGLRFINPSLGGPAWDPHMKDPMWKVGWPFITLLHYPFLPFGLRWGTFLWLGLFIAAFLTWCVRQLKGSTRVATVRNVFVFSFLTYPFLFELDRANPEMFVFIFMAVFFCCYGTSRHVWGLVALSAAIAMKAFPGVYLILLLCDRRIKDFFLVGVLAVGLNVVSAAILPGGYTYNIDRWLFQMTDFYQMRMVIGDEGLKFFVGCRQGRFSFVVACCLGYARHSCQAATSLPAAQFHGVCVVGVLCDPLRKGIMEKSDVAGVRADCTALCFG